MAAAAVVLALIPNDAANPEWRQRRNHGIEERRGLVLRAERPRGRRPAADFLAGGLGLGRFRFPFLQPSFVRRPASLRFLLELFGHRGEGRLVGDGAFAGPSFGRRAAPRRLNDAERHVELPVQVPREEIRNAGQFRGGVGRDRTPFALNVAGALVGRV